VKLAVALAAGVVVVAVLISSLSFPRPSKTVTATAAVVLLNSGDMPSDPPLSVVSSGSYLNWTGPGTSKAWLDLQGPGLTDPMQVNLTLWVAADANAAESQYSSLVIVTPYKTYDLGVPGADHASYLEAFNCTSGGTSSRGLQAVRYNVVFYFYFESDYAPPYPVTLQEWVSAQVQQIEAQAH